MDVLTPRSLDEALQLKAELPRRPLRAGRHRRARRAQLRPLPSAGADQPERGAPSCAGSRARTARSSSARRSRMPRRCGRRSPSGCPPWPRRRGRSARRRSATAARSAATSAPPRRRATRCRRCSSRTPRSSSRACGASVRFRSREFLLGVKQNALEPDELVVVGARATPSGAPQTFMKVGPRNAMVISVCSLALAVDRERGELRAAFGSAAPTVAARDGSARRGRELPGRRRRRARARSTTCAAPPPTADTRCACSRVVRSRGASHEDRADASTASAARRRSGVGRACSTSCASGSACRARRTRASRASAARAPSCSTARSSAPASCSRRRPTGTR